MLGRVVEKLYLDGVARALGDSLAIRRQMLAWQRRRGFGALDRKLIGEYLARGGAAKLHIGCGPNLLEGWLNSDLYPESDRVLHFDATGRFPFADDTFDYVFSEHMIEHVPYEGGLAMLRECRRVLKPGGRVRISTPDLRFLVELFTDGATDLRRRYMDWATRSFTPDAPYSGAAFVINNFVRAWGHSFIHDEQSLRTALERAGFAGIRPYALNESDDPALRALENEARLPEGFVKLESLTLEATK